MPTGPAAQISEVPYLGCTLLSRGTKTKTSSNLFYLSTLYSISRQRAAAGVSSDVTGGCSLPQLWVGEPLAPFQRNGEHGRGRFPPHRSCARSDQAGRLGTKEETPAVARFRKAKVQFQILSDPLAHICRILAPNPICFGKSPGSSNLLPE
jgi:hypothetical protein